MGYDSDTATLEVELSSGRVYRYFDVPEAVYLELMDAASKGRYYNRQIRDAYRYTEL